MPAWELLDDAICRLESSDFEGRWYASAFREAIEAELKRIFEWLDGTLGIVELHPSKRVTLLADIVQELKGARAVSPEDIVREALLVLDGQRDSEGKIPGRVINNYYSLRMALEYGDCQDWTILSLAKGIIFAYNKE